MSQLFLGVDIGSTTLKAVLVTDKGKVRHTLYQRTRPVEGGKLTCTGRCGQCGQCNLGALQKTLTDFLADAGCAFGDIECTVVTGSQIIEDTKRFIPYDFQVSEVTAHVAGALKYYPDCQAILDVGGQDSKAMIYNEKMRMWTSKMSGICAAGTGAFLDSVAAKLSIPIEDMADKVNYDSDLEVSSICAVLSATSINKFKNRYPLGDIIGGACRAQARTVISGVGEIFYNYKGTIIFQGGVASNQAVAYYLKEITGNEIAIPKFHRVMGALGAAYLAQEYAGLKNKLVRKSVYAEGTQLKSITLRAKQTSKEFFSKSKAPLVWRNLFFPSEILNALGVRSLTLETYAALHARSRKKIKSFFDKAAYKGFSAETCSFLRVLEGCDLPKPDFGVSTAEPCQQGERIFADLVRSYGLKDRFYSLQTPITHDDVAVEHLADGLAEAVSHMEKAMGLKMDMGRLAEACDISNEARGISLKCNELRFTNPPLIRGGLAVYFSIIFSQLWGRRELVDQQKLFLEELEQRKAQLDGKIGIDDTHRVLWLHLPPFYDSRLLDFIELSCGAPIVFEEVNFIGWEPLDTRDPYRSLARKLLTVGFLDPELRVRHIKNYAAHGKFNGCILYNHGFGRCSMADSCFIKHLREELQDAGIPLLVLDGDCVDPTTDPCSTFTKISAYIEALNCHKYGNFFGVVDPTVQSLALPHLKDGRQTVPFAPVSACNSAATCRGCH